MKKLILTLLAGLLITFLTTAQNTYTLKGSSLSFTSADEFMNIYDNTGYAVYKSPRIEVTMKKISSIAISGFDEELSKQFPVKQYIITKKVNLTIQPIKRASFIWEQKRAVNHIMQKD